MQPKDIIPFIYTNFNQRNIDEVFRFFDPEVKWPNGWEGGYVHGLAEVRDYWTRQWKEINPVVTPLEIRELPDGRLQVKVHQFVKDMQGNVVFDDVLYHTYTFSNGLITLMEISQTE